MAVLLRGKLLFLAHPRTASTALRDALLERGGEKVSSHHAGLEDSVVQKAHRKEPVLTVVRNPYDILVSWWIVRTHNRPHTQPLSNFISSFNDSKGNFVRQGRLLYHSFDADHVVRYESLDEDLNRALTSCGLGRLNLRRLNETKAKTKPWQSYYDQEAVDAANKRFGDEISSHGYDLLS